MDLYHAAHANIHSHIQIKDSGIFLQFVEWEE